MPTDVSTLGTQREQVLYALQKHGAMTDDQLVTRPELQGIPESGIRSRRADLVRLGEVVRLGLVTNERGRPVGMYRAVRGLP